MVAEAPLTRLSSRPGPLQAATAARQAFAQEVHALLDRHREPSADELFKLTVAFLAHRVKCLSAGCGSRLFSGHVRNPVVEMKTGWL